MPLTKIQSLGITDGTIVNADINASAAITGTKISNLNDAKAWVNFDGTGTISIRGSFNVSSLTDNGTGNYTVNFTTAMTDVNYCALTTGHIFSTVSPENVRDMAAQDLATWIFRFCSGYTTGTLQDSANNFAAVFR